MKIVVFLALVLAISSCSFSDSNKEEVASKHDDLEFAVDQVADQSENIDDQKVEEYLADVPVVEKIKEAPEIIQIEEAPPSSFSLNGPMEKYKVQKGETLMMIAFKIYGDYHKWKDIKGWNNEVKMVKEGVELNYVAPEQKFGWSPVGLPYLVKSGDTLGTVSLDKYGTPKKWRAIYENNRPLIKNPNLIFAGFTIYYQPDRSLASEPK